MKATATERRWAVKENARNIHQIDISLDRVGDEQWVLWQTDAHWDNPHCQRDKFLEHLDQARERDAPVLDNGDFFCAMGGKWDPRSNKADLRPEHQTAHYFDSLIDTSTAFMSPYADLLTVRAKGNHCTSVLKRHETDLTERFVQGMKTRGAKSIAVGGFSGYVIFTVTYNKSKRKPFKAFYHHGYGGGGAVTRGVIGTNRQAVFLADADIVFTGHTHDSYAVPIERVRLNQDNTVVERVRQLHLKGGTYKDEYADGYSGYHIEGGRSPRPISAWWLVFRLKGRHGGHGISVDYDAVEAK